MRPPLFAALSLLAISSAHAEGINADFDRGALMREASQDGFQAAEEKRLAKAAKGDIAAILDLGRFYMAHSLWIEALSAFDRLDADAADALLLKAECAYRMGRYAAAAEMLADSVRAEPLRAMALTRLGAFEDAAALFRSTNAADAPANLRRDYRFSAAEAFAEAGDGPAATTALEEAGMSGDGEAARRDFIIAAIRAVDGQGPRAAAALRRAAAVEGGEWTMRARLALAASAGDIEEIETLSLQYRGGAFERDMRLALGELRLAGGDFDRGFAALARLVDRYPQSDDALAAQDIIAASLARLFAAETALHPKDAARLFFEYVEFAPPGAEGDALIREASDRLVALGLYRQAADLLEHQTFKRLRGAERARVAADLADTLLLAGDAKEALRVIRSTRFSGLDGALNQQRKRIEARALAGSGDAKAAIALLADASDAKDVLLRAEISWTHRAWAEAARDYAAYAAGFASFDQVSDRAAAVRGATAFLLAGDRDGYRSFAAEMSKRLKGAPEARLIETLGDVDRERFLSGMMDSYRALYGASSGYGRR